MLTIPGARGDGAGKEPETTARAPDPAADGEALDRDVQRYRVVRGVFQGCYLGYAGRPRRVEFMFTEARLHRIMANSMPANSRSAAVLARLGFTIEGTARDYLYLAGARQDHVLTSLTNDVATAAPHLRGSERHS